MSVRVSHNLLAGHEEMVTQMITDLKAYKREWMRKDRTANPEKHRERSRRWRVEHGSVYKGVEFNKKYYPRIYARQAARTALLQTLKDKPCMDCGNKFPTCCMQFDHRDPAQKTHNVSRLRSAAMATLMTEVAKCDVVCANCHFIRTDRQKATRYRRTR